MLELGGVLFLHIFIIKRVLVGKSPAKRLTFPLYQIVVHIHFEH